ncbi:hypothetical protein M8J75_008266 [Diaphorina citri]|nr:hypothetical protein M8J75_008266 [Diaphorina citri]
MEGDSKAVETTSSSPPPTKKLKFDSDTTAETSGSSNDKPLDQPITDETSPSKKHPAKDSDVSVPNNKLKPDETPLSTDKSIESAVLENITAVPAKETIEPKAIGKTPEGGSKTCDVQMPVAPVKAVEKDDAMANSGSPTERKLDKQGDPPKADGPQQAQDTRVSDKVAENEKVSAAPVDGKEKPVAVAKLVETKEGEPKPSPVKVLKKLPGLNPIRPMMMGAPRAAVPAESLLKQQLTVVTESMGAPMQTSRVSPVRVSPTTGSPKSPGRSPTFPGHAGIRVSPVKQIGGATLSPVSHMGGATLSPVRNKSPVQQMHRGSGLVISPVKQQQTSGVTISPVRQREVNLSPFLSGEVTISPIKQQGVTISPSRQPQLSPEIRSQIPEGISITAISPTKAKSPVRQMAIPTSKAKSPVRQIVIPPHKAKSPVRQMVPPPKAKSPIRQVPMPLPKAKSPIRQMPGPGPRAKSPVGQPMVKPPVKVVSPPAGFPQQIRPQGDVMNKPTDLKTNVEKPAVPVQAKMSPSQETPKPETQPIQAEGKVDTSEAKPNEVPKPTNKVETTQDKPEAKPEIEDVEMSEPPAVKDPLVKEMLEIKPEHKSNEQKVPTEEKSEDVAKAGSEKAREEEESSEESSDEESDENEDNENNEEKPAKKIGRPTRAAMQARKLAAVDKPARALRTRKSAAVADVAVKLTRIDDDLEDGALPPWNMKKHLAKAAQNEGESGSESAEGNVDTHDDDSNSQGSKSCQSTPRPRGRPRKVFSPPVESIDDYTSHDSLHAALKKIIADEGLEPATSESEEEEEEEEDAGRRETKQLLSRIPFFSRRGGRAGAKGKAIGKNNQFDNRIVDKMVTDKKFRNELLKQYQDDRKKREEKKMEKIAEAKKKIDERQKAAADKKAKLKIKAEERRRKYEEQKQQKLEEAKKKEEARRLRASLAPPQNFDDDTRMSFPRTPGTPAWKTSGKLESLEDGDKSESRGKRGKMETIDFDSQKEFPVHNLAEYQWPLQGGEHFMIQEQVAAYLGVKSFKRKYPDLKRRGLEPEERTYICDSGLVSEAMIELGLTAVQSADIMDIMYVDFPEKYEEVKTFTREKQARELIDRQRAFYDTTISEQTAKDLKESLVEATALWNAQFNRLRRETRKCSLDLQTFVVHYPAKANPKPMPKVGHYPVAILPGQYCDYYKEYTATELKYMPLNTVLYGPLQPNEQYLDEMSYSEASQSDSDDSSGSSGSSSGSSSDDSSSSDSDDSSSDDDAPRPLPQTPFKKTPGPSGGPKPGTNGATPKRTTSGDGKEPNGATPKRSVSGDGKGSVSAVGKLGGPGSVGKKPVPESDKCKACDRDTSAGEMIQCGKCVRYLHPACLDLPGEMLPHMKLYDWQCSDCKSCVACEKAQDDDKMLFCDLCDRGYHNYCIGLDKIPTGRWHCKVCSVCSACNTTQPNPEWEHEVKKGPKGQSVYQRTLCTPCAKSSDNNSRSQKR